MAMNYFSLIESEADLDELYKPYKKQPLTVHPIWYRSALLYHRLLIQYLFLSTVSCVQRDVHLLTVPSM